MYYLRVICCLLFLLSFTSPPLLFAQEDNNPFPNRPRLQKKIRQIMGWGALRVPTNYRDVSGRGNNLENPELGSSERAFRRIAPASYVDGKGDPDTFGKESARVVSNACSNQLFSKPNVKRASDFLWQWGQFLDHDITLTPTLDPVEEFMIEIPIGDKFFDPMKDGDKEMRLKRSDYVKVNGERQQINKISAFIDASNVYGSDPARARELRTFSGDGTLKESEGRLLPFNTNGFENEPVAHDPRFFLAGDIRANEQLGLTALHTLFVREHNYWAHYIKKTYPKLSGTRIYQLARSIVAAEMQVITYKEFLPILLGKKSISKYRGYDPSVDPTISNEFATAAYRFGHSMLSSHLLRLESNLEESPHGHLLLREAFFQPERFLREGGIESLLRGLAVQRAQAIDIKLVDDVRNFLFGRPGAGGFDLAALNIQRNRDHGLPSFNIIRNTLGLPLYEDFNEISSDPEIQSCLHSIYSSVDDVELWVGGLAEDRHTNSMLGETFTLILAEQFERLRDGDRFWYQHYLPKKLKKYVAKQSLSKIVRRNSSIGKELQKNLFIVK